MGQTKSGEASRTSHGRKRLTSIFEISPTTIYRARKKNNAVESSYNIINTDTVGLPVEEFFENYELTTEVLGSGSFAEVRLAECKSSGDKIAVKIIQKRNLIPKDLADVRREVEILKNLRHQNIIQVYDYYEDKNIIYITMEYVSGGELVDEIDDMQDFSENDARDIMLTLIHALRYCKNRGVAHRDIKPENILLRRRIFEKSSEEEKGLLFKSMKVAKQKYEIALADFGFAIQVPEEDLNRHALETGCGTPVYAAPELIRQQKYNYKCDVWSLGILCYLLLSGGHLPFDGETKDDFYVQVLAGKWDFAPTDAWQHISKHAKSFMKRLLVQDPEKRATYEELIDHPWFKPHSVSKTSHARSVNMEPLKRFNAKRKMLGVVKARQAAETFKLLMDDIELENADDENLSKYLTVMKLSDFYTVPQKPTSEELYKNIYEHVLRERQMKEDDDESVQLISRRKLNSAYFDDLDDIV